MNDQCPVAHASYPQLGKAIATFDPTDYTVEDVGHDLCGSFCGDTRV